jgi:hypothetical protein
VGLRIGWRERTLQPTDPVDRQGMASNSSLVAYSSRLDGPTTRRRHNNHRVYGSSNLEATLLQT